jgi:hypothetical protein
MNKSTIILLLIFTLILTACSGNISNASDPASTAQGGPGAGELSTPMKVAIGTIQLDGTDNTVTVEQARELLPLWETLQVLYGSDTAATQEIDALLSQIQDTMTEEQMQAITTLNLTRQDMFSIMQTQGMAPGSTQNGDAASGTATNTRSGGFGPSGGGFVGGPPPDGGEMPMGGDPNFQGQRPDEQSDNAADTGTRPTMMDPNRIPTPLIQAVIEYLKTKAAA